MTPALGLKPIAKRVIPRAVRSVMWRVRRWLGIAIPLGILRCQLLTKSTMGTVRFAGFQIAFNDAQNLYILCKDIFVRREYHFTSLRTDPYIVDCGSNIGVSILYSKSVYPDARIIGFEPDPEVYRYLTYNLFANGITSVDVRRAAVGPTTGAVAFWADGLYGSSLMEGVGSADSRFSPCTVECVRLRDLLNEPVDFLKINIEGAEYAVLSDCAERLQNVSEMIVEYHHLPGLQRTLHKILTLLHDNGFEYIINDFEPDANPGVQPPFDLTDRTRYFLLIYAKRVGLKGQDT